MNQSKQNPVVVVMGAGNATGSAVARRFASEGFTACVSRRNEEKLQPLIQSIEEAGGQARAFGADARKEEQVQAMFQTVEEEIGPIEVCVFNVGGNVKFPLEETTSRVYYKVWEMGCFAGFLTGREAVRYMKPRGRGTILFYRCNCIHAWGLRLRCLPRGQIWSSLSGPVPGAVIRPPGNPCWPCNHRWSNRYRMDRGTLSRNLCQEKR